MQQRRRLRRLEAVLLVAPWVWLRRGPIIGAAAAPRPPAAALASEFATAMEGRPLADPAAVVAVASHRALQRALLEAAVPVEGPYRRLANDDGSSSNSGGGIDLTQYALKYTGCSNIRTWSDDAATDASSASPLVTERFVTLRLCEASACTARNRWGCSYNYGEYMLPMETYLTLMYRHHTTQMGYYCKVCRQCLAYPNGGYYGGDDAAASGAGDDDWAQYSTYWDAEANDDAAAADGAAGDDGAGDDYYADDVFVDDDGSAYNNNRRRRAANNNGDDASTPWYIDATNGTCMFDSVCSRYKSACQNPPTHSDLPQYFACGQHSIGSSGKTGYLGPHCHSDGRTIDIGLYDDADCNTFLGETQNTNLQKTLGLDSSDLALYSSKTCIPCAAEDAFALLTDAQLASSGGDSRVYSLCNALYEPAAKCQRAFADRKGSYASSTEFDSEQAVCDMIKSLVTNSYDEFGDPIVLQDFDYHHWTRSSEYVKLVRKATGTQIFLLVSSILVSVGLFVYAARLHRKLRYRAPWVPPRAVPGYGYGGSHPQDPRARAGRLSRGGSGIVANRTDMSVGETSQTGGQDHAYYPRGRSSSQLARHHHQQRHHHYGEDDDDAPSAMA